MAAHTNITGPEPESQTISPRWQIWRELHDLRRLARHTRRQIDSGQIDPIKGGLLITRACNSIARLLLAAHRISITPPENPLEDEFIRALEELDRRERQKRAEAQKDTTQ